MALDSKRSAGALTSTAPVPTKMWWPGHRMRAARAAFAEAMSAADGAAQRQAVSQAHAAFERSVQAVYGEFVTSGRVTTTAP